jgi:hypothetical protein
MYCFLFFLNKGSTVVFCCLLSSPLLTQLNSPFICVLYGRFLLRQSGLSLQPDYLLPISRDSSSCGSTAQFWALVASMKLSVSFQLDSLDEWSARRKASANCPGLLWWWRGTWDEWFWQEKPKYSEKTCPDATLSTTNSTSQTWARTRAAAVGSQRLTASAMARPN